MIQQQEIAANTKQVIIPITDDNIDECVSVYITAYNSAPWNYRWTEEMAKEYLNEYRGCSTFVGFALYDEGTLVAAVFAHTKTWWTSKQLMIDEFFVSNRHQRRGYGKILLAYCDEYSRKHDIQSTVLMTNKYMPSYQFYTKEGYVTAEQYVFMFKQV